MKWALMVKGWACSFLGGQGVCLQGPRGSRGGPSGSQRPRVPGGRPKGIKVWAYRVTRGQGGHVGDPLGSSSWFDEFSDNS